MTAVRRAGFTGDAPAAGSAAETKRVAQCGLEDRPRRSRHLGLRRRNPLIRELTGRHRAFRERTVVEHEQVRDLVDAERSLRLLHVVRRMLEPARHPGVHRLAAVLVVVVLGGEAHGIDV
jgi:hypothetical protein